MVEEHKGWGGETPAVPVRRNGKIFLSSYIAVALRIECFAELN